MSTLELTTGVTCDVTLDYFMTQQTKDIFLHSGEQDESSQKKTSVSTSL